MAHETYHPDEVAPAHAAQVLGFLNAVRTASELDDAITIHGIPDIGPLLARRVLDRRDELGGFTDLHQVMAVPLIGPVRFTQIVASLSSAPFPGLEPGSPGIPEGLLRELQVLRREIRALGGGAGAPPRIRLRALQPHPFLGQAVNLVAHVTEADGRRPRPDAPVTLLAVGGLLRAVDGPTVRQGQSVTTRTDGAGMARVALVAATGEELLPVQHDSLQVALQRLAPGAATPREAEEALTELARAYRWDGNVFLREAIDILFRDFGSGLLESVNTRDHLGAWRHLEVVVVAHLRDEARYEGDGTTIDASAAHGVRMRNWLGPWLELMQRVAREESTLAVDLERAAEAEADASVLGRVYRGIQAFLHEQRGLVGEHVGRQVAERSLLDFAQTGIAGLPAGLQAAVLPALDVASTTVARGGTPMVAVLRQARTELHDEMDRRLPGVVGDVSGLIGGMAQRVATLESELARKLDGAAFAGFQREVELSLERRPTSEALQRLEQELGRRLEGKADAATLQTLSATLEARVGRLQTTLGRLDQQVLDLLRGPG
jgi:hypothetical protein